MKVQNRTNNNNNSSNYMLYVSKGVAQRMFSLFGSRFFMFVFTSSSHSFPLHLVPLAN